MILQEGESILNSMGGGGGGVGNPRSKISVNLSESSKLALRLV